MWNGCFKMLVNAINVVRWGKANDWRHHAKTPKKKMKRKMNGKIFNEIIANSCKWIYEEGKKRDACKTVESKVTAQCFEMIHLPKPYTQLTCSEKSNSLFFILPKESKSRLIVCSIFYIICRRMWKGKLCALQLNLKLYTTLLAHTCACACVRRSCMTIFICTYEFLPYHFAL